MASIAFAPLLEPGARRLAACISGALQQRQHRRQGYHTERGVYGYRPTRRAESGAGGEEELQEAGRRAGGQAGGGGLTGPGMIPLP